MCYKVLYVQLLTSCCGVLTIFYTGLLFFHLLIFLLNLVVNLFEVLPYYFSGKTKYCNTPGVVIIVTHPHPPLNNQNMLFQVSLFKIGLQCKDRTIRNEMFIFGMHIPCSKHFQMTSTFTPSDLGAITFEDSDMVFHSHIIFRLFISFILAQSVTIVSNCHTEG